MTIIPFSGQWTLTQAGTSEALPAQVPGCVHLDLLAAGRLADPNYRDNEAQQYWIGETDWLYRATFTVEADLLQHERVYLRALGLDTLATVKLNGAEIAQTANMYRTWEWDVKALLQAGENTLEVTFAAPMPYQRRMDAERGEMVGWVTGMRLTTSAWLRKEPCNFGWDWGPKCVTSGVWRPLQWLAFDNARLTDVEILQDHSAAPQAVTLTVRGSVERVSDAPLLAEVTVALDGVVVAQQSGVVVNGEAFQTALTVTNPRLWWVAGMGEQPLYTVTVALPNGETISKRVGLRTLLLDRHADEWGESFQFTCNGVPFFAKGANWIPADPFAARLTVADYTMLIEAATAANMNMLRVWGGGIYEDDAFYDLCDQHGIAIWQDFMFACGVYPVFDAEFVANVRGEVVDNLRRLRHHPCMALWCGNNEIEQGMPSADWQKVISWEQHIQFFDTFLGDLCRELAPQTAYWPGSPHTPLGDRNNWMNPDAGDTHLWMVWHGKEPFEWYRTRPDRFCSEFGFQSFPQPSIIAEFSEPLDRNLTSYIMEYHQRSGIGNSTILHYMLDWYRLPNGFENLVWLSQILQGMAMKYAVEHWRRNMPRTMGTLYWQINDCWPGPTWSSLDYKGNWKALHYMAKRFYAPVLVSGLENTSQHTVEISLTSDLGTAQHGTLAWIVTNGLGATLLHGEMNATAQPRSSALQHTLALSDLVSKHGVRDVLVWLDWRVDGAVVSSNLVTFARPKHLHLQPAALKASVQAAGDGLFEVSVTTDVPALYVWLDVAGGRVDDGFVDMRPGQARLFRVSAHGLSAEAVQAGLHLRSLLDLG